MAVARDQGVDAYRCERGTRLIEIRVRDLRQLFDRLEPAPCDERDLDPAVAEHIVGAMRESRAHRSRMILHLPPGTTDNQACEAVTGIRRYFTQRSHHARGQLRVLLVRGVVSLAIGLTFLVTCLSARGWLAASMQPLDTILSEGLLILGWVAMWRPVEIFLYDWWPVLGEQRFLERAAHMIIETQGV